MCVKLLNLTVLPWRLRFNGGTALLGRCVARTGLLLMRLWMLAVVLLLLEAMVAANLVELW